ncbi:hypothetical protein CEP51_015245 [Fusarium floridanum]|uniref:Aldehyde dehydrogenase domain-containing protein n=1 Tax=Fusarium floridanum TaxID=1325733 RepID=A0A428PDL5_9HYPO|nr:hypothetical protein CEP51_015245 [Fusarium floridanum]
MEPKPSSPSHSASAVARARAAFTTNTPISGYKWKQRQLYGLCELLTQNRKELIQALCEGQDPSLQANYEQELALVLQDIARHYDGITRTAIQVVPPATHQILPVGVSVLLIDNANPIRFLFSSLGANIALGNTVILAYVPQRLHAFWTVVQRELPKYLDQEAFHALGVSGLELELVEKVDLVSVFAPDLEPYADMLQLPKVQFFCTRGGSSLVVVDEGPKSYDRITRDIINSHSFMNMRPEAVNTVFIPQSEMEGFQKSFNAIPDPATRKVPTPHLGQTTALARFSPFSYSVELARLVGPREKELSLGEAIKICAEAEVLLFVAYRSIDQVIDALRRLKLGPTYLTLLAPNGKANSEYFEKWTTSQFYSLGYIRPCFPTVEYDAMML